MSFLPTSTQKKAKKRLVVVGAVAAGAAAVAGVAAVAVKSALDSGIDGEGDVPLLDSEDLDDEIENRTIYTTKEWEGYGKIITTGINIDLKVAKVVKYKCHRQKIFDGDENEWREDERVEES